MRIGWKIRELFIIFLQISSNNFFPKRGFLFHKGNFFSQTARCSLTPMSLGSSASFRRIVPFRDTSTMESEIPSFRDAKPHEPWELVPLGELSLPGILQLRNQRFQVSGMRSRSNLCWHLVIARSVATWQSCQRERIASPLWGFAMT